KERLCLSVCRIRPQFIIGERPRARCAHRNFYRRLWAFTTVANRPHHCAPHGISHVLLVEGRQLVYAHGFKVRESPSKYVIADNPGTHDLRLVVTGAPLAEVDLVIEQEL